MVDILERLQSQRTSLGTLWPEPNLHEEAAEKIIQLREELAAVTERMSKLDFERTAAELERDALREENARLRLLVKTAYAEGCYDSTKTEKTQEEFEALWKESFAYNVILEGGKVKAEAACPAPDEAL